MTITAKHAIITDQCRSNRGDIRALLEAWDRVRAEYEDLTKVHAGGSGVKFHIKLEVEFPERSKSPQICPACIEGQCDRCANDGVCECECRGHR